MRAHRWLNSQRFYTEALIAVPSTGAKPAQIPPTRQDASGFFMSFVGSPPGRLLSKGPAGGGYPRSQVPGVLGHELGCQRFCADDPDKPAPRQSEWEPRRW